MPYSTDIRPQQRRHQRTRRFLGLSLLLAGVGVVTQYLAGVPGFPLIPPGPIILGVAGLAVVAFPRHRWPLIVGLAAALFLTIGGLIEGSFWRRLADPAQVTVWIGVFLQWSGQLGAIITGLLAVWWTHPIGEEGLPGRDR